MTEAVRYYLGTGASRESDAPSNVMPRLTKSLSRQARGVHSILSKTTPENTGLCFILKILNLYSRVKCRLHGDTTVLQLLYY